VIDISEKKEDLASKAKKAVEESTPFWQKILSFFPGYRGYKDKELLRETDRIVREVIFRKMKELHENLREVYRDSVSKYGVTEETRGIERLVLKIDEISQKIKHAPYGYTPIGYAIDVNEEKLDKLVEFDASLVNEIEEAFKILGDLKAEFNVGKLSATNISKLSVTLNNIDQLVNRRREILFNIG
jgi:hypothetical protein